MRAEQITFTRFFAALSIVVFHFGKNISPFNESSIKILFLQAHIGVSYFFLLSGFIMILAYKEKGKIEFVDYIKRRFARIYPVYGLAILLLIAYQLFTSQSLNYQGIILNLALLQSWVPGMALSHNFPGWSISVEMFFYVSFPFLLNKFYKKYSFSTLLTPIILLFVLSQIIFHVLAKSSFYSGYPSKSHDLFYYFPLMHLNEFLIGNLAGLFFLKGIKVRNYDLHIVSIILLVGILLSLKLSIDFHNGMLAIFFVPLIILISANNGNLTRLLNHKIFIFFGEISFGMYILQAPTFLWVSRFIRKVIQISNPTIIFYSSLSVLIIFASISYKYYETPLRELINKVHLKS
jgi:peptidoglycan/LPS O-acetylase OafA/YrhL